MRNVLQLFPNTHIILLPTHAIQAMHCIEIYLQHNFWEHSLGKRDKNAEKQQQQQHRSRIGQQKPNSRHSNAVTTPMTITKIIDK